MMEYQEVIMGENYVAAREWMESVKKNLQGAIDAAKL